MGSRLGLSVPEARALPWHVWDLYVEGITWDLERQANLAGVEPEGGEQTGSLEDLGISVREV